MKLIDVNGRLASRYNIEALARGLNILQLFTPETPSLSMTEIVAALKLSKSTIFRILATLETMGYLERDSATRRYHPSLKVLQLGFRAISRLDVRRVARLHLERLAREADETVSLCVLHGRDVVYVDRIRNRSIVGVVLDVGSQAPAHCTTMGKILMADLEQDHLEELLGNSELVRYTPRTVTDRKTLFAQLACIRKSGYAISDGELAVGLRAAGAPIRDVSQKTVAAINVSGSVGTISLQRLKKKLVPAVVATAREISLALGYNPCEVENTMVWKSS